MTTPSSGEHNHTEPAVPETPPLPTQPSEPEQSGQKDQPESSTAASSDQISETTTMNLPATSSIAEASEGADVANQPTQPGTAATAENDVVNQPTQPTPATAEENDVADQPTQLITTAARENDVANQPTQIITAASTENDVANQPDQLNATEQSPAQSTTATKVIQRKVLPRLVKVLLIALAALLVLGGGSASAAYYYYKTTIQQPLKQIIRPVARSSQEPTPLPTTTMSGSSGLVTGRTWNILLLGSDNDQKYVFPNVLTQVMMVIHVDTIKNTVTMVSIPRDSWVSVPDGMGMHKIDQAFLLGVQETGKFEDGVRLARQTVEQDYGIHIDRYAWVGLDGFAKVIDTLHGIDINVDHPVVDDAYPNDVGASSDPNDHNAYKRLYLTPGPQHLNGQEALEYVRSRHSDLVGDIGRTQRQQQVLEALKLKLNVSTLLQNFSSLLNDLSGSVYTDLNEDEMLAFANYGRTLLNKPINHLTLGIGQGAENYGELATIYDPSVGANQDVIIPHCNAIQPAINHIFDLGNTQSCHVNS
ncbi:LCP family protein [Dictyobacter formicarum]|uniref:Cell envelope-related transcriptional attenuator domain-containing protein n=1 Tax=Dictyobacter formicarum TaxID=2778368 RepID=A0ABQ3VQK4_9CHLR|nr:LCP family protein [Dictyobacter formicarum]GHO87981.1 hypothetical protein KSZ_59870 [Dictyobacter formicarum]